MKSKLAALNIAKKIIIQGRSLKKCFYNLSNDDNTPRIQEYCYGFCRHYFQLKFFLSQLVQKPLKEKNRDLEILILLAMYEITYMKTPEHAAVNEWVNVVNAINKPWAKKMVNAVLRNYVRKKSLLLDDTYSHPAWLVNAIKADWPNDWQAILHANNAHPPMICRVNQQKMSVSDYLEKYTIAASPMPNYPNAIRLDTPCAVNQLPGFQEGQISIQDCSAQLAAQFLQLAPNLRVLDACAAPGGKTCHIAEREPSLAYLLAIDNDNERLLRIRENLTRLGLKAEVRCGDATNAISWSDNGLFDRILLDAPCSATGVIRRNPDIKIHRRAEDIVHLTQTQQLLLTALWPLLKPGGILLYATCSLLSTENDDIVRQFLAKTDNAIDINLVHKEGIAKTPGLQFIPSEHSGDGFYYAAIRKTTE